MSVYCKYSLYSLRSKRHYKKMEAYCLLQGVTHTGNSTLPEVRKSEFMDKDYLKSVVLGNINRRVPSERGKLLWMFQTAIAQIKVNGSLYIREDI